MDTSRESQEWDADTYDDGHSYVTEYGSAVVSLLEPAPGERILDLGCGTGHLSREIAAAGATVLGLDASEEMIARARREYPKLEFRRADARDFSLTEPVDAVFSNAALHWIAAEDHENVLSSVRAALVPDGRFVAEFGGHGNVEPIVDAVKRAGEARGYAVESPWYFPTIGEYTPRLEARGFEVRLARLFDRPTALEADADGLRTWLEMFGDGLLDEVPETEREAIVTEVEDALREEWFRDGVWVAPYRRFRFVAVSTADEGTIDGERSDARCRAPGDV